MAFFVNKLVLQFIFLVLSCNYFETSKSALFDGGIEDENKVGRKFRDFSSEPRRTMPLDLRRAGFYNDLMERDDDNDDDSEDEDDFNRFQRDVEGESRDDSDFEKRPGDKINRNTREAVYDDLVERAFNDDITDLGTFFDGQDRVDQARKKFTRDTDSKAASSSDSKDGDEKKKDHSKPKADNIEALKEGQKEGDRKLDIFKKKLKKKEDFILMFNKYPEEEIDWKEPRILPNCWIQAMLSETHDFFSPSCNMDGTFGPKQCFQERCWCVKPDGKPVEEVKDLRFKYLVDGITLKCQEQTPKKATKNDKPST